MVLDEVLASSVEKSKPIVLTTKAGNEWNLHKSYFKSLTQAQKITCDPPERRYGSDNIPSGKVGVSFRVGHKKVIFHSTFHENRIAWPTKFAILQRTAYAPCEPPTVITVRLREIHQKNSTAISHGQLINFSAGGMKVSLGNKPFESGCYACAIDTNKVVTANAITKNIREANGRTHVSFQFVGLEFDQDGQHMLDRIARMVKRYHLAEARRSNWTAQASFTL